MYNFKRLIKKYTNTPPLKIVDSGYYDYTQGGVWVEDTTETEFEGAIFPLGRDDAIFGEAGVYGSNSRKLYTFESFELNDSIKFEGIEYTVKEEADYSRFEDNGLRVYALVARV